jgi:hypothetical protein
MYSSEGCDIQFLLRWQKSKGIIEVISPNTIVDRYWRYPWTFKVNGDLYIQHPTKTIVIKEADYVPKSQRKTQ